MKHAAIAAILLLAACDSDPVVTPPPTGSCFACQGTKAVTHRGRSVVCPRCEGRAVDVAVFTSTWNIRWDEWKSSHDTAGESCHAVKSTTLDRNSRVCLVCKRSVEATHGWTISADTLAYYSTLTPNDQRRLAVDAHALMDAMVTGFKSLAVREVAVPCRDCKGTGKAATGKCDKCKGTGQAQGPMH